MENNEKNETTTNELPDFEIYNSPLQKWLYVALFNDLTFTYFGRRKVKYAENYIDDEPRNRKRKLYEIRNMQYNGLYNDHKNAKTLERYILWGDASTIEENIEQYKIKYLRPS